MENIEEFNKFFNFLQFVKGCTPITIKNYKVWLQTFVDDMNIKTFEDVQNLTTQDIDDFMTILSKKGNSPTTRNTLLSCLRSFFDFLKKRNLVSENIAKNVEYAKIRRVEKIIPTHDEFCKMLEYMSKYVSMKYYTAALLLADTGLRFSEMAHLKISDVDFSKNGHFITITGKGEKERKIYISEELKTQLRHYVLLDRHIPDVLTKEEFDSKRTTISYKGFKDYEEYLDKRELYADNLFLTSVGMKLDNKHFNDVLKKAAAAVGVNVGLKDVSAHSLRHFFTTYALDQGVRIDVLAEMLGHSSISTTQRYIHRSDEVRLKESERVFNFKPRD